MSSLVCKLSLSWFVFCWFGSWLWLMAMAESFELWFRRFFTVSFSLFQLHAMFRNFRISHLTPLNKPTRFFLGTDSLRAASTPPHRKSFLSFENTFLRGRVEAARRLGTLCGIRVPYATDLWRTASRSFLRRRISLFSNNGWRKIWQSKTQDPCSTLYFKTSRRILLA